MVLKVSALPSILMWPKGIHTFGSCFSSGITIVWIWILIPKSATFVFFFYFLILFFFFFTWLWSLNCILSLTGNTVVEILQHPRVTRWQNKTMNSKLKTEKREKRCLDIMLLDWICFLVLLACLVIYCFSLTLRLYQLPLINRNYRLVLWSVPTLDVLG